MYLSDFIACLFISGNLKRRHRALDAQLSCALWTSMPSVGKLAKYCTVQSMTTEARPLATSNQTTSIRKHFSLVLNSSRSIDSACRLHQIVIRWRTAFSCVITQQVVVIPYRHFGTNCQSHFSPTFPEDGTDKLSPPSRRKPEITNIRVIK